MASELGRRGRLPPDLDIVHYLNWVSPVWRDKALGMLAAEDAAALHAAWPLWAHDGQLAPAGDWSTRVLMAGRGFGKTLAGAQWLTGLIADAERAGGEPLRIALVGASLEDARRVMVEGRSGLLTVAARLVEDWSPSLRRLRFAGGAEATLFSGASPDLLRGPEHHLAWCDELAKWERARDCWDMLRFGLRLGAVPRALVTTTPRPGPLLRTIMAAPGAVVTRGRTRANPHLSAAWKAQIEADYAGTRLGRQELDGELLPEAGALWTPELIERCRLLPAQVPAGTPDLPSRSREVRPDFPSRSREGLEEGMSAADAAPHGTAGPLPSAAPRLPPAPVGGTAEMARTLVAVDPPAGDGTCGIVAVAREGEGPQAVAHVLADHSVAGRSPEGWARAVAAAAATHGTTEVVAEANQGGRMVQAVLLAADPTLRVRLVTATRGKSLRAEPVAMWCEAGRVRLHGAMPALEAQLLGLIGGGGYEGPGASPDRADAMVWGVTEVMREVGARVRGV